MDRGPSGHPCRERLEVAQRRRRVGETQRFQPIPCRSCGEAHFTGFEPCDRLEQRAVEQLLVESTHFPADVAPLVVELPLRITAEVQGPGDPTQIPVAVRDDVGPLQPVQLQSMFQSSQEAVGTRQSGGILSTHIAVVGERLQRAHRVGTANHRVTAPVHHLQQLDTELDVAKPPLSELQLPFRRFGRKRVLNPSAHRLDILDEVLPSGGLPHQLTRGLDVTLSQFLITRGRARLEQCLELPGLRPALVVAQVTVECAHQRPRLALGSQPRIHLPQRSLRAVRRTHTHQGGGQLGSHAHRGRVIGAIPGGHDKDHIDIGHVVEFFGATLAHCDDRQAAVVVVGGFGPRDRQRGLEGCIGEPGQPSHNVVVRRTTHQVGACDLQQHRPVRPPHGRHRLRSHHARDRCLGRWIGAHRLQHGPDHLGPIGHGDGPIEQVDVTGMPHQMVREGFGDPEHADRARRQMRFVIEPRQQHVRVTRSGHDPGQREQREIRIGGVAQLGQQVGAHAAGQRLGRQVRVGAVHLPETQTDQGSGG